MTEDERYHLIDLLELDIEDKLRNDNTLLSHSQRLEDVKFDMDLINKLKEML